MQKKTLIKLGGFIAAAAATASLVGFAANGTGAYFSDSHSGSINASTGHLNVTVTPSDGKLDFTNLLPGEDQNQTITYTAHTTSNQGEDVWLVITPPQTQADGGTCNGSWPDTAEALNGAPDDACGGGLGRYGHFAITSTAFGAYGGASFQSYNLSTTGTETTPVNHTGPTCSPVDANGNGGSSQQAANKNDLIPFCPVPNAILLAYGLTDGNDGSATVTFGFTKLLTAPQDGPDGLVASYKIIATQHNVSPTDVNNSES